MIEQNKSEHTPFEEIQFLIFNVIGIRFGVNIEQISEMLEQGQLKGENFKFFWFHEKIPFHSEPVFYKSPKVLLIKDEEMAAGIIIDQPEDIISIKIDSIRPIPSLIEACNRSAAIWGVALRDNEVILLVDFYKLLACKTITTSEE